jgi:type I restriction enzyme S subunit
MSDWHTEPLDECLEALLDYRGKSPPKSGKGVPVLSAKVVKTTGLVRPIEQKIAIDYYPKWMVRGLPRVGDVVMTTEAPMGEVIQLDAETVRYALGQRIVCMRGKPQKLDNTFLRYLLISPAQQAKLSSYATGTTVLGISQKALRSVPVSYPRFDEQKRIGELLGALDDKIELNRMMNETLEAMARAIFKDWFVDFGPTRAKMEGHAPYLAPDIWSLFPDRLDDGGKPEGWSVGSLSDIAVLNPESWSRANYPELINYVDLSNTKWGIIEAVTQFTSDAAPSRAQRILRPGDTVVGTVRPGNGSYAVVSADSLTGSTGFAVLRPIKLIYREAIYLAATSKENIGRLAHLADGGAYPAVRPELVAATELAAAPEGVFSAFSAATSALVDRAEANKSENYTLAVTRDFLLPKLMSGEVRVKDAAKHIGKTT